MRLITTIFVAFLTCHLSGEEISKQLIVECVTKKPDDKGFICLRITNSGPQDYSFWAFDDSETPNIKIAEYYLLRYDKKYDQWLPTPMTKGSFLRAKNEIIVKSGSVQNFQHFCPGFRYFESHRLSDSKRNLIFEVMPAWED
ncbi:MAG: hypothetical protein CMO55_03885 [Verrucomicrobiales bacterium]|nr:hypothetical protein [Verrucomicrobiales bacterium]